MDEQRISNPFGHNDLCSTETERDAKERAISDTIQKTEHILKKIDERWPTREQTSVSASQPAQGSQPTAHTKEDCHT